MSHGFYSVWDSTALVLYVLPRALPSEVHAALTRYKSLKNHETTITWHIHGEYSPYLHAYMEEYGVVHVHEGTIRNNAKGADGVV